MSPDSFVTYLPDRSRLSGSEIPPCLVDDTRSVVVPPVAVPSVAVLQRVLLATDALTRGDEVRPDQRIGSGKPRLRFSSLLCVQVRQPARQDVAAIHVVDVVVLVLNLTLRDRAANRSDRLRRRWRWCRPCGFQRNELRGNGRRPVGLLPGSRPPARRATVPPG